MENHSSSLKPFYAMEIFAKANELEKKGEEICHLEVGEPGGLVSQKVIATIRNALDGGQNYTSAKGMIELREALAQYYEQKYRLKINSDNIITTVGSSAGFTIAFLSAFARGAKIALTRPGYPAYLNIVNALGLNAVEIALNSGNNWRLSAEQIEEAYKIQPFDGLLFASPANPTGACVSGQEFEKIVRLCKRLNVRLISDEIYHGLEYGKAANCALQYSKQAIIVNSFSKYFLMTGHRIGWLIMPDNLVERAEILQQNMFISAPTLSQIGAIAALKDIEHCERQKEQYLQNRNILAKGLSEIGFANIAPADGAFYSYVDISQFSNDAMNFCQEILQNIGVAITPGIDFDRVNGHRYVRFSFAGERHKIELALEKLSDYLRAK